MSEHNSLLVIRSLSPEAAVVFGLEWESLVGAKLEKQSHKHAVELKATHYVRAGRHSTAFGYAHLLASDKRIKGRKYYSAAAIFAQAHPQGVFWERKDMDADSVWVVAVQDGVVITGTDAVCSPDAADEIVHALTERYPHIVQVSEREEAEYSYYLNDRTHMIEVKTFFEAIPLPLKVLVSVMLVFMLTDTAWQQYKSYQSRQEQARIARHQVDIDQLWAQALDQWQSGIRLVGSAGLHAAYISLVDLPLKVGNWNLTGAGCDASASGWACEARYERTIGTNRSFQAMAPTNWSVVWNGLNGAVGRWEVPYNAPTLDRSTLRSNDEIGLNYISALQSVLPAFETYTLSPPEKPTIADPQMPDPRGAGVRTFPHPENGNPLIAIPSIQRFRVEAPLRSMALLPMTEHFAIDSFHFSYGPTGAQALTKSMFSAVMTGKFYVK